MSLYTAAMEDVPEIEAFLAANAETSMFLRSNLAQHGPCGGTAPHATQTWLEKAPNGTLRGVYGISAFGMALMQSPGLHGLEAFAAEVAGREVLGVTGAPEQIDALCGALGLSEAPARHRSAEPLYHLTLSEMHLPDAPTRLVPPAPEHLPALRAWRERHHVELFGAPPEDAVVQARNDIERMCAAGRLRVLVTAEGAALAKTGFNAVLPDIVQIGYVYTPPALRNRGHARRAVALHLAEARAQGVTRALLFAANAPACRAYEAIGFRRIGSYALVLFDRPQTIRPGAAL